MEVLLQDVDAKPSYQQGVIPKSDIELLHQEIRAMEDGGDGMYRVRGGSRVYYLHIAGNTFDEDTMCRPYLLIAALPDLPCGDWTEMRIWRTEQGVETSLSFDQLPGVQPSWHTKFIDVLTFKKSEMNTLHAGVSEVIYDGRPVVLKVTRFPWLLPNMNNETFIYGILAVEDPTLAPQVLGHVTENGGRIMGILLEKLDGRAATIDDLAACEAAVRRFHDCGLIHGDVNRNNFIIDDDTGRARLIDFEHVRLFEAEKAEKELESLKGELVDSSGRGGTVLISLDDEGERRTGFP